MNFKIDQQNHGCKKMTLKLFPKKLRKIIYCWTIYYNFCIFQYLLCGSYIKTCIDKICEIVKNTSISFIELSR